MRLTAFNLRAALSDPPGGCGPEAKRARQSPSTYEGYLLSLAAFAFTTGGISYYNMHITLSISWF